jgi:hypothetical protein
MNTAKIEIETAIRRQSWATVQVGRKSLQVITVDFNKKKATETHTTGKTVVIGTEFGSIRDIFSMRCIFDSAGGASITAKGQTASAVGVMPNINYQFSIILTSNPKTVSIAGSHDGYPSYNVAVNGISVYDYVQGHLGELFGDSDVEVKTLRKAVAW